MFIFVDFVKEIVDAVTDQSTENVLHLLESSLEVCGKLLALNKKRTMGWSFLRFLKRYAKDVERFKT